MSTLSNLMFVAAVIGGPIVLALLYLYGMKTTREKDRIPHSRDITDRATKELYKESEAEREHQEKAAARSDKIVDVIERKTGTTG
ncbi:MULTISPECIES: hypothetical protein [unclassified Hyphomicrobium]|uniref:hypothetical protein n=1 Tax=unclassified Hyphomicrobium TaxID=2619925 RepID=UPI000213D3B1|nr:MULTISPECIES: hypothetical protein [unclassified Hyphomicrobium]CCB66822.1 exported protein of unknown function [Hyphomicrobium sp. MC1]